MVVLWLFMASAAPEGWEETGTSKGITTYARERAGSDLKELLAVGVLSAPPAVVHRALDDLAHYKDFMPYTQESRIIKTEGAAVWTYERINAPLVAERDYTICVTHGERKRADGVVVVQHHFKIASDVGPPPRDGVVRVELIDGRWELEPLDGGARTRASYFLYTSPGGSVPIFAANMANQTALPNIFLALEKVIHQPRYASPGPAAATLSAGP